MSKIKLRKVKSGTLIPKNIKVPRGVRPPTAGYRTNGAIMKNGGCKKK